jgi:ABC-type transport system substrate-binding protein
MLHYAPFEEEAHRCCAGPGGRLAGHSGVPHGVFCLRCWRSRPLWRQSAMRSRKPIRAKSSIGTFQPARRDSILTDLYSNTVNEAIFERLLTYDYLARPAKLVPMAAEAMPEVTDQGKTYVFKLRKGIFFTPDTALKGQKRELTAQDFVYSYMRFMDPANRSQWAFMLEGKIVGLDAVAAKAKKTGKFDYDAKVPGMEAVDRYSLRFRLTDSDYNFPYIVAHVPFGAMAREIVEAYPGEELMAHPVGTGPYVLKSWTRRSKIVLEANPDYRGFVWDFQASDEPWDQALIAAMKGKQMPQVGRVEITIIEEPQSVWLAFQQKELDYINVPPVFAPNAFDGDQLKPELAKQGITHYRAIDPEITYTAFNIRDPIVGGFAKEKIALRRALAMAYDVDREVEVLRKHQAVHAQMPIPAGVVGHDPKYRGIIKYDPDTANKLLDYFGYKKGPDGWRTLPDGKPLVIHQAAQPSSIDREFNALWQRSAERIGVRMVFDVAPFGDNLKAAKECRLQLWGAAWTADYPDGDNFMQLLYGPNTGQSNNGCYESKAFDKLYEQAKALPNSPERNRLFLLMSRQMEVDTAWSLNVSRLRNELIRPWVLGFKKHPILHGEFTYVDVRPH